MASFRSLVCACSLLLLLLGATVAGDTFTNPLKDPNGSDPFIVYTAGEFFLFTTTWTDIEVTHATTLEGLKTASPTVLWTDSTASRSGNFWAPEAHWLDNKWYIYYTAGTAACCDNQRPHVLVSSGTNILGPYSYAAQLSSTWGIDGTVLRFTDATYFAYSAFSPAGLQSLYLAELTTPTSLGTPALISQPTNSWETVGGAVNEGPAALYHGGKTYLTFSASYCWTTSYQLGLLTWTGGDPLAAASWTKSGPVFSSADGNLGTGHNCFFTSPDGTQIWMCYHATEVAAGACDGNRYTMASQVTWNSNGSPNFGVAPSLSATLTGPAGE